MYFEPRNRCRRRQRQKSRRNLLLSCRIWLTECRPSLTQPGGGVRWRTAVSQRRLKCSLLRQAFVTTQASLPNSSMHLVPGRVLPTLQILPTAGKSSLPQPFLFLLQDSLYGFPRLFTVTSEHIRLFYFLLFFLFLHIFSCRFRAVD